MYKLLTGLRDTAQKLYKTQNSSQFGCGVSETLHFTLEGPRIGSHPSAQDIFRWARGGSDRACTLARIPCSTTVPSTKATQNATQVVALSTLAGPPGPSRSCYVLRVRVFDDHWRPLATTGDQWRGCSVRAHTLPGTTTLRHFWSTRFAYAGPRSSVDAFCEGFGGV
jgi:hypothetical protein